MIIFYADKGFELDLTGTGITLVEENDMFFDYFVKDYSLPFEINVEKFTDDQIRFLHLDNVALSGSKFSGLLFVDNKFRKGYLTVKSVKGKIIKGIIYHGSNTLPVLETKLADLPWPVITTGSLKTHAEQVILQSYPDVDYNFPMIIDLEFNGETNYDKFLGIINNYENNAFIFNTTAQENSQTVIYNKSVLTPFPYLIAILKMGFGTENIELAGDFVNDAANHKLIWDTSKYLEKFSNTSTDEDQLGLPTDSYVDEGVVLNEYEKQFNASITGTYKLKVLLNLPLEIEVQSFVITHNGDEVYNNAANNINEEVSINVPDAAALGPVLIKLITKQTDVDLTNFTNFVFESTGEKLNVYPKTFSLSEIMPDITFGKFLTQIKKWLNLKIVIDNNFARIDYIKDVLYETDFSNKTPYEIDMPLKEPHEFKLYKLQYQETDYIYIGANGQVFDITDFAANEIDTIDMDLKMLPIEEFEGVFTAKRNEDDPEFKILIYDGLQTANNLPIAVESINGRNYRLPEIYSRFYKPWLHFLLNSITFTDSFQCDTLEDFNINEGQFKYNEKHIFTKISKQRKSEKLWVVTCTSKTIY